ncbi:hypothetical protein OBBRIDRAFT_839495 [Obba rivulosa]|uniref:G domain-containing protein n=1 Tax=Obba rivulosa TaxID=1052685 RepID=A0A8E2DFA0_9APHY|nr:hypothetical protein OBBRIDRAFT_839495 [Obba rivulosa]
MSDSLGAAQQSTASSDDVLIAVMGPSGTGKSSFINLVSGSNGAPLCFLPHPRATFPRLCANRSWPTRRAAHYLAEL